MIRRLYRRVCRWLTGHIARRLALTDVRFTTVRDQRRQL